MITRIYADNYKSLSNFTLELKSLSLILGENGTGKTTAVEVVDKLRRLVVEGQSLGDLFARKSCTRWDERLQQKYELDLTEQGSEYRYLLTLEFWGVDGCRILSEKLLLGGKPLFEAELAGDGDFQTQLYRDDHSKGPKLLSDWERSGLARLQARHDNTKLVRFRQRLNEVFWVTVDPWGMKGRSESEDARPDPTLSNWVSWYRHVLQEENGFFVGLQKDVEQAIPGFRDLQLSKVGSSQRDLRVQLGSHYYDLMELSEGQRTLLVLYILLHRAIRSGQTLILDEPENFVTLREMQPWLTAVQDRVAEGAQVVLISHHPEFVNYLAADCGIVFSREAGTPARAKRWEESESTLAPAELMARGLLGAAE
ncbi:MAG: ATP-binding protein [Candidatus Eremiobacteraeota bacterium]|nr:ATP-binding protein [Candidatus Eremiobacteraeota bacterium]MCW5870390.1 ATP-binding protein [Candidatus Eremiobacteraeota bacterium]